MDGNKELKIMASVDIKAGDVIYNNYTAALYVISIFIIIENAVKFC